MSAAKFAALSGIAALIVAGCAAPEPVVRTAQPLYSKSGEALCIDGDIYDPNTTYDRPICDEICEDDYDAAGNVAICPPYYDPQRPGGDGDPQTPPTGQQPPTGAAAGARN